MWQGIGGTSARPQCRGVNGRGRCSAPARLDRVSSGPAASARSHRMGNYIHGLAWHGHAMSGAHALLDGTDVPTALDACDASGPAVAAEVGEHGITTQRGEALALVLPGDRAALAAPGLDALLAGRVVELPCERQNLAEAAVAGRRDAGATDERAVQEDAATRR